jgi:hypothetical protein
MSTAFIAPLASLLIAAIGWSVIYGISIKNAQRAELRQICNRIDDLLGRIVEEVCEAWVNDADNENVKRYRESKVTGFIEKLQFLNDRYETYTNRPGFSTKGLVRLSGAIADLTEAQALTCEEGKADSRSRTRNSSPDPQDTVFNAVVVIELTNDIASEVESRFCEDTSSGLIANMVRNGDIILGVLVGASLIGALIVTSVYG